MKKVVQLLIKLQDIDSRFDELKLQKGDLPILIEQVEEDISEKKSRLEELQNRIEKLQADRKMFENEIEANKALLKKYEEQLYQVKTNKEYDAISLEIDTKNQQLKDLDNKILQTMEEEEELEKEITELREELEKLENQLVEYKKELDEISQQTREEEAHLLAEREELIAQMDKSLLRRYERIRAAKGGIAVAPIKKSACGGCFSALPPQKIVEIRESARLYTCEYCGRILVWAED